MFLVLLLTPALFVAVRLAMFYLGTGDIRADKRILRAALAGAAKDTLVFAIPLFLAALLSSCGDASPLQSSLACLGGALYAFTLFTTTADWCVFIVSRERVTALLLDNISWMSAVNYTSTLQKALLLPLSCALVAAGLWAGTLFAAPGANPALPAAICALALAATAAWGGGGVRLSDAGKLGAAIGKRSAVNIYAIRACLTDMRISSVGNFISAVRANRSGGKKGEAARPYTGDERRLLSSIGLLRQNDPSSSPGYANPFKRIVVIALESVSLHLVPSHNPAVPKSVMPFVSRLWERNHHLDNCLTANMPTLHGLHALYASRLQLEFDMINNAGRIDTLPSLLAEQGFASHALVGHTRAFYRMDRFMTNILRFERFSAEEDIRAEHPTLPQGAWGIADSDLFSYAQNIVEGYADRKLLLHISTMGTHPPYYPTLPPGDYPEEVRALQSKLAKTLYETDTLLRRFLAFLARGPLSRETLVIITADHSPNQGAEYLKLSGAENFLPSFIPMLFVAQQDTPLLRIPAMRACSQLDMLPTLCEALGLRSPNAALGRSILGAGAALPISQKGHHLAVKSGSRTYTVDLAAPKQDSPEQNAIAAWYANNRFIGSL